MSWSEAAGLRVALAACAGLALAACGFQLKGAAQLPEGVASVAMIVPDELSPFGVELREGLERAGARITPSAKEADAVVRVLRDRSGRRVLSVSARNTPEEYEIFYTIEYAIDRGGREVVPPTELSLTRNISFDEARLLAKDREEQILRDALARDLSDLVLRRVQSL